MDKTWCNKCDRYTHQTTGGCMECGQVTCFRKDITRDIQLTDKDFQYFIDECDLPMSNIRG